MEKQLLAILDAGYHPLINYPNSDDYIGLWHGSMYLHGDDSYDPDVIHFEGKTPSGVVEKMLAAAEKRKGKK